MSMYRDRTEAGSRLADRLATYGRPDPLVLALPRGGLPVALPVAQRLGADLDVLVVRKLGAPGNPEFAMGAVGEDGILVMDHQARRQFHVTEDEVSIAARRELAEVDRRVAMYRHGSRRLGVAGRNVIIVDDGLATGSTAAAAVRVVRGMGARHVTLAVPVGSVEAVDRLTELVDDLVCLQAPEVFWAVGQHYDVFDQISDEQVLAILSRHPRGRTREPGHRVDDDMVIDTADVTLAGHLCIPLDAAGVVVFVHGTGSDRASPRNRAVAGVLQAAGLGTLLVDMLTPDEVRRGAEPALSALAQRVIGVGAWLAARPEAAALPLGYFGSSSGAAVALVAAAQAPDAVRAVVSRGGRPDQAAPWLADVRAPTLLIVGGRDLAVLDLNRDAERVLTCPHLLEVVRGAGHLFEEEGTLQQAAALARSWFLQHLAAPESVGEQRHAS
jgi:putative phosphoribosyl transferase